MKYLSTTALAKLIDMNRDYLFQQLEKKGLLFQKAGKWNLTPAGEDAGGILKDVKDSKDKYIAWPENIKDIFYNNQSANKQQVINVTSIGQHFGIPSRRINSIFSELGWIKKGIEGWLITGSGKKAGGKQAKVEQSGVPYVRWPESIINNKNLIDSMGEVKGDAPTFAQPQTQETGKDIKGIVEFRDKFKAEYRTMDGHWVRSRAEMSIDNWLYVFKIIHAYERKLPVEEDYYCDFYIPTGNVYIEFWGYDENDPEHLAYSANKRKKLEIYKKYDLKLIELTSKHVYNLDDTMPKLLLGHGIKIE